MNCPDDFQNEGRKNATRRIQELDVVLHDQEL